MSSSTEVGRRGRPRRRAAAALGVAVLAGLGFAALRPSGPDVPNPVPVKREDLVLSVELEGELAAVRSTEIGTPAVSEVEFKISFLIAEGTTVKKGEKVLGFDTERLQRQLAEKQAELAEASKKIEQKQVDLGLKLLEVEQQAAQAEADRGKASLKADVPPEVQQRIELEKARLDLRGRQRDLENLQAERRVTQSLGDAELRSLLSQRDRAKGRVEALQAGIEKLTGSSCLRRQSSERSDQPWRSTDTRIVRRTASFALATWETKRRVPASSSRDPGGALSRPTLSHAR